MGDDLKALPDLDLTVYTNLAAAFRTAADSVSTNFEGRIEHAKGAIAEWEGEAVTAFVPRFNQGVTDGSEVYMFLHHAASLVDGQRQGKFADKIPDPGEKSLLAAAQRENKRRFEAREWLKRREHYRNNDSVWSSFKDAIGAEPDWETVPEIGPMPEPVPEPFLDAPTSAQA